MPPRCALLTIVGVSGWTPLTLLLRRGGDPVGLARRLQRAWWQAASGDGGSTPPPARQLTLLLRHQGQDFEPLPATATPRGATYRHRLRGGPGERQLHLRSWIQRPGVRLWEPCGGEWPVGPVGICWRGIDPARASRGPHSRASCCL